MSRNEGVTAAGVHFSWALLFLHSALALPLKARSMTRPVSAHMNHAQPCPAPGTTGNE